MNNFYTLPTFWQWFLALLLLIVGFLPALVLIELTYQNAFYSLLFLLYVPVGQFSTAPFFKLIGVYTYYSPMLLGYMANETQIDLHSGGSFDYLFVMTNSKAGLTFRNCVLKYHLEGLLNIIKQIEKGAIPETVIICGTSYFMSQRTIHKLGFELKQPSMFYRINLFVNMLDLIWMYSISKGYFKIPAVWKAQKAETTGSKLIQQKNNIIKLHAHLSITNNQK
jgi:hypothetical protein